MTSNSILRRSASCLTSSITGSLPLVPITSWLHFQGIFSATDNGVWPNCSRNCLEGFFLRLRILPAINNDIMLVRTAVDLNGAEREFVETHTRTPCRLVCLDRLTGF